MTFADHLKRLRVQAGLTQEQLAHACGYPTQSRIGNYESNLPNAREPKASEIAHIAKTLGVPVGALFGESQSVRLDPATVAMAHRAVRDLLTDKDTTRVYNIEEEPALFVHMYALTAATAKTPQGATKDGRGDAVPAEGAGTKRVARAVRDKAETDAGGHPSASGSTGRSRAKAG